MRKSILIAIAATLSASPVCAQAWLPAAGQGAIAVIIQDMVVHQHLLSDGESLNVGRIDSHNVMLDVTYGLTGKLALDVSLPYISARYKGAKSASTFRFGRRIVSRNAAGFSRECPVRSRHWGRDDHPVRGRHRPEPSV
jgi:hypothetical protein